MFRLLGRAIVSVTHYPSDHVLGYISTLSALHRLDSVSVSIFRSFFSLI